MRGTTLRDGSVTGSIVCEGREIEMPRYALAGFTPFSKKSTLTIKFLQVDVSAAIMHLTENFLNLVAGEKEMR